MNDLRPNEKYKLYVSVILKAMEYRDDPLNMAKFIMKNKKFFPKIKDEDMETIIREYENPQQNQT